MALRSAIAGLIDLAFPPYCSACKKSSNTMAALYSAPNAWHGWCRSALLFVRFTGFLLKEATQAISVGIACWNHRHMRRRGPWGGMSRSCLRRFIYLNTMAVSPSVKPWVT
ncbi:MAG: hypothetical protein ABSB79_16615 [Syntrophales bacterium]